MSNRLITRAVLHGRKIGTRGLLDRMFAATFQNFVYNQIWEDPDVDLEALRLDRSTPPRSSQSTSIRRTSR